MKRKTGFGLLVAMALSLTLLLLPTSQAERSRKSSVVLNPPTSERTVTAPCHQFRQIIAQSRSRAEDSARRGGSALCP